MQRSFAMLLVVVVAFGTLLAACSKAPVPETQSASRAEATASIQTAETSGGTTMLTLDVQDMV